MEMVITLEGKATVKAHYNGHVITTDQPQPAGDNSAPPPFDLFLASIGTCAGIYVKSFCAQRGIPTDQIKLVQTMELDPARHMVSKIGLDIQLPPDFPEKYRSAVINAAELCAVKKHLHNPPEITVSSSTQD
jgi:ribosomal protein S12 methylthiotransferase accessory factor